jgi:hypothetical protein
MNSHYMLLKPGDEIKPGDQFLAPTQPEDKAGELLQEPNISAAWKLTSIEGYRYDPTNTQPHRRLIQLPTPTPPTTTMTTTRYRILNLPKTKPVRCIVLIDGKSYVEGVSRSVAKEIVLGHMLATHPDLTSHKREAKEVLDASGI